MPDEKVDILITAKDQAGRVFRDVGREAGDFARETGRHFQTLHGRISKLQSAFALLAGAYGVGLFAKASIRAASDLEETSSKFRVVFRGMEAEAGKWASGLQEHYAMSARESRHFLASVQDLLVPMGMAAEKAGDMSFEVTKLAADLGSFNNMPTARVMDDIQSALVGNYETMKKYGVVLNAAVVQQEAMRMGLARTKDELTAANKAQAAFTLMVRGSKAAVGDMARTSGGYANQMKQLKANMEDLSAALGETLLPAITNIVVAFNSIAKAAKESLGLTGDLFMNRLKAQKRELELELAHYQAAASGTDFADKALGWLPGYITQEEADLGVKVLQARIEQINRTIDSVRSKGHPGGLLFDLSGLPAPPEPRPGKVETGGGGRDAAMARAEEQAEMYQLQARETLYAHGRLEKALEDAVLREAERREQRMAAVETEYGAMMDAASMFYGSMEEANRRHAETMNAIDEDRARQAENLERRLLQVRRQTQQSYMNLAAATGNAIISIWNKDAKKQFIMQRTFQTGLAVMSAFLASNEALASPPGPPATIPLASAVLKMGLVNAAAIAAQSIGQYATAKGSGGSLGGGGGGAAVGVYEANPATGLPAEEEKGSLTIIIEGDFYGDEAFVDRLAEKINEAVDTRNVYIKSAAVAEQ